MLVPAGAIAADSFVESELRRSEPEPEEHAAVLNASAATHAEHARTRRIVERFGSHRRSRVGRMNGSR